MIDLGKAPEVWNLGLVRFTKEFLLDAFFFAILFLLAQMNYRTRFSNFFYPVSLCGLALFVFVCAHGATLWVAEPLLQQAEKLAKSGMEMGCTGSTDVLVVLGGGAVSAEVLSSTSALRVLETAHFIRAQAKNGLHPGGRKVILSGGMTSQEVSISEAAAMERILRLELGPLASQVQIILEGSSKNTYENAYYARQILDKNSYPKKIILVTSKLHLVRAAKSFAHLGMEVCPIFSPSPEVTSSGFISFSNGARMMGVINEYAGIAGYWVRDWL